MSGGGGTTTSNTSTTVPQSVIDEYNNVTSQANNVAAQPLQQYGGQIVAGLTPDELSAFNTIDDSQATTAGYTQDAGGLLNQSAATINPQTVTASQIQGYESPYTQNVLNTTEAAENNQDAQQQAQLQGNAISSGAWGGDRAAVAQGILAGQQDIANNATNAGIENTGYTTAEQEANTQQQAGIAAQEASQQLEQSAGLGENQVGTSALTNSLNAANAQYEAGQAQQQQAQSELNVPYEEFLQEQAYPFQTTGWLGNIAEGIGSNEGGTSTSSTTQPSEGLFSDRRLKKNIRNAGILKGRHGEYPFHTFEYKGSDEPQAGVIAQEVEKITPDAVHRDKSGYRKVDYSKLARGGIVKRKHFDTGGATNDWFYESGATSVPPSGGGDVEDDSVALGPQYFGDYFSASPGSNNPNALVGSTLPSNSGGLDYYQLDAGQDGQAPEFTPVSVPTTAPAPASPAATQPTAPTYAQFAASSAAKSGTPYTGGTVAGLNSANQADLNAIYSGKFRRGGIVKRDTGGATNDYSDLTATQLSDMAQEVPSNSMEGRAILAALTQKETGASSISGAMKRGGLIPRHFDAGGGDDSIPDVAMASNDYDPSDYAMSPGNATGIQDAARDGYNSIPSGDNGMEAMLDSAPSGAAPSPRDTMPAPTPPPNAPDHPANSPQFIDQIPQNHEANPWLAVAAGVLGTLAGRSRNPLVDIGQGGLIGLNNYAQQQKEAEAQDYSEGSFKQNAQKLAQETDLNKQKFAEEQLRDANTNSIQQGELGIRQQELNQLEPIKDMFGNITGFYNKRTGVVIPYKQNTSTAEPDNGFAPSSPATTVSSSGTATNPSVGTSAATSGSNSTSVQMPTDPAAAKAYIKTLQTQQPKDRSAQEALLTSLLDQKTKIDDLAKQIPVASSGDLHTLQDFADRNQLPVLSDPKRANATVVANYDTLGNVLDNIKTTFGGTGRVLAKEFDTLKTELNAAQNQSPEQKAAVVGHIQQKINAMIPDEVERMQAIRTGAYYLPSYQSAAQRKLSAMIQQPSSQAYSGNNTTDPMRLRQ